MPKRELVSLFTDASFCHGTGAAGWGWWAKRDGRSAFGGCHFKREVPSVNLAELRAAVNGVVVAHRRGIIRRETHVLLQSDNMRVVQLLNEEIAPNGEDEHIAMGTLVGYAKTFNFSFNARHVKAHVRNGERRHFVNNIADREARRHMELARKRLTTRQKSGIV